jgi:hypothetical protein
VYLEGKGTVVFSHLSDGDEKGIAKLLIHETQKLFPSTYTICLRFSEIESVSKCSWINSSWRVIITGKEEILIFNEIATRIGFLLKYYK